VNNREMPETRAFELAFASGVSVLARVLPKK
jgi:hypothetical protein